MSEARYSASTIKIFMNTTSKLGVPSKLNYKRRADYSQAASDGHCAAEGIVAERRAFGRFRNFGHALLVAIRHVATAAVRTRAALETADKR
jgi:hypothetical protein